MSCTEPTAAAPHRAVGRHLIVVDLETRPDGDAVALAGDKRSAVERWCLHRIGAASVLDAVEFKDGAWEVRDLRSWCEPDASEIEILEGLETAMTSVFDGAATLLTYSGRRHDVEVIRRRAAHHLLVRLRGLAGLRRLPRDRHVDVFDSVRGGNLPRPPSLVDACAGLGFSAVVAKDVPGIAYPPAMVVKGQTDVVATFLVHLFELALETGRADVVLRGWTGLAAFLLKDKRRFAHLARFWRHPYADWRPPSVEDASKTAMTPGLSRSPDPSR